jgi:hypothetical protein
MQTAHVRYVILIAALLAGAGMYAVFGEPQANVGTPRWPDAEAPYQAEQWSTGPEVVQHNSDAGHLTDLVTRTFRGPGGMTATLTIVSSQTPKLYGSGAEVPFLGNGYTVSTAPSDIATSESHGISTLVAQRGTEQWLVAYAFGERRGLLGNGLLPWTFAVMDGITGQPNDYYKLYLTARTDRVGLPAGRAVVQLAGTLFPRIAAWYAA